MPYKHSNLKGIKPIDTPCRKAIYHTREEAMDMINYIEETRVTRSIQPYKCSVCGFWHLTSRGAKDRK